MLHYDSDRKKETSLAEHRIQNLLDVAAFLKNNSQH